MDWSPLWISFRVSCLATLISLVAGVLCARGVQRMNDTWKSVVDGLCTLPMVLPPTVLGFLLLLLFGRANPFGRLLASIGIRVVFTWWGAVIAATTVAFPLMYRSVRAALERIDPAVLHAARTLGLPESRIFFTITLPLARSGMTAGIALSFTRALGEFGATLMIAGNIPGKTATIPLAIYFASEGNQHDLAFVWVAIILVISFAAMAIVNLAEGRLR